MNFNEAIEYINSKNVYGSILGLERVRSLCSFFGNPQNKLKFIHIAGTNGKGSTAAFISNILASAGYTVGRYISPAVHDFSERITINNIPISHAALAELTAKAALFPDDITEFELVAAIAFQYFLEQKCDYVVLEVGLGGRFDATNIIPSPEIAVITSISIDHTEQLGDTISKIAYEKCGIIKPGARVVVYPHQTAEALRVIKSADPNFTLCAPARLLETSINGTKFEHEGKTYELSMLGEHQIQNAATAITAMRGISYEHIYNGLKNTRFPARFECLRRNPYVIIDGAHNHGGAVALSAALQKYFPGNRTIVMGMLADKEYEKCVSEIAPLATHFIATQPQNPRALDAAILGNVASRYCTDVSIIPNRDEAVHLALNHENICICGSLYLLNNIETCL